MYQPRTRRNTGMLWILIALGTIFIGWLVLRHTVTGVPRLDGTIGVLLGLFAGSRGAGNLLDIVLYSRTMPNWPKSNRARVAWVALNVAVLVVACALVMAGANQFAQAGVSRR